MRFFHFVRLLNGKHKQLHSHLYLMVNKEYLAVSEKHDKLISSLRTTVPMSLVEQWNLKVGDPLSFSLTSHQTLIHLKYGP